MKAKDLAKFLEETAKEYGDVEVIIANKNEEDTDNQYFQTDFAYYHFVDQKIIVTLK